MESAGSPLLRKPGVHSRNTGARYLRAQTAPGLRRRCWRDHPWPHGCTTCESAPPHWTIPPVRPKGCPEVRSNGSGQTRAAAMDLRTSASRSVDGCGVCDLPDQKNPRARSHVRKYPLVGRNGPGDLLHLRPRQVGFDSSLNASYNGPWRGSRAFLPDSDAIVPLTIDSHLPAVSLQPGRLKSIRQRLDLISSIPRMI